MLGKAVSEIESAPNASLLQESRLNRVYSLNSKVSANRLEVGFACQLIGRHPAKSGHLQLIMR